MSTTAAEDRGRESADLGTVLDRPGRPFALLHRPESTGPARFDILTGRVRQWRRLADLPLPPPVVTATPRWDLLALVPYRQIAERGLACHDDGTPLLALQVQGQGTGTTSDLARLPDRAPDLRGGGFDIDDRAYARLVRRVLRDEIGRGAGANFVIKRSFTATVAGYSPLTGLSLFRRLLDREAGAYWTFLVYTGDRTLVGATPERHVGLAGGRVTMNPISGTYRYPPGGPTVPQLLRFLADRKEVDELYMVVDEELKMMGRICDGGGRVVGPRLRQMARLAHTEYVIEGPSTRDMRTVLRETMFAPTITGSPLASACQVITRYEQRGRGYYGGALALMGQDTDGPVLDAAIAIRTADIDAAGRMEIGVGATLVRHSDADGEVAETHAKAAGLLAAAGVDTAGAGTSDAGSRGARTGGPPGDRPATAATAVVDLAGDFRVRRELAARNHRLSRFWLADHHRGAPTQVPRGTRVLVVDAEDTFTEMLGHQIRALGAQVTIRRFDQEHRLGGHHLVVVGPGPGDPRDRGHPKIAALERLTRTLLAHRQPFLSVCLGHQVLAALLGLELVRRPRPNQGVQRRIDYFGRTAWVGFYNSFEARAEADELASAALPATTVQVSRDPRTGEVHGLRGPGMQSMQFHVESLLTEDGPALLAEAVATLIPVETRTR